MQLKQIFQWQRDALDVRPLLGIQCLRVIVGKQNELHFKPAGTIVIFRSAGNARADNADTEKG